MSLGFFFFFFNDLGVYKAIQEIPRILTHLLLLTQGLSDDYISASHTLSDEFLTCCFVDLALKFN